MPRHKKQYQMFGIDDKNNLNRCVATKHGRKQMDVIWDGHSKPVTVNTSELYDSLTEAKNSVIQSVRVRRAALKMLHVKALDVFDKQIDMIKLQAKELRKNIPVLC